MKFALAVSRYIGVFSLGFGILSSPAQTTTSPAPSSSQEPAGHPDTSKGRVIFSRSTDQNGNTSTQEGPGANGAGQMVSAPIVDDTEREALTFTDFDMDVHVRTAEHHLAVRAMMAVRNDGKSSLAHIPLQLSSDLRWEQIRLQGKDIAFKVATLNSDADHTGQLHEAEITLAQPLPPGASLRLDVTYSGNIASSAQRLLAIGTPQEVALHSDWDQIDTDFTGLRGFGNVVWYPASAPPVILGDGARLFDEMGEHKLRLSGANFRLHVAVEFPHGHAPTVALVNGHPVSLSVTDANGLDSEVAGIATAETGSTVLGFEAPSLFIAIRKAHAGTNLTAWTLPDNEVNVQAWLTAAADVTPFLQGWLGQRPRSPLTLLDLPDPQDAPYETGALLATNLRDASALQLEGALAHALTHAWMQSPRAWLSEGVAHFMGTLWIEKQEGRDKALSTLEAGRTALALAEPGSPGESAGQPLEKAISPVYYRTKATYVLWMLREIAGDDTLSAALRAYDPSKDVGKTTYPTLFERLLEQAGTRRNLSWFFSDWVDADKGLPDLTITSVYPTPQGSGNYLVAVNVANSGYAVAEVPVTVRTDATSVTQRVRVPARGSVVQRILIQGPPTEVQVNDGTVPETEASVHVTQVDPNAPALTSPGAAAPVQH